MTDAIVSIKPLTDWRGSVAVFDGFFNTLPADELFGATWGMVRALVAPADGPALFKEKERATYFVPCALRVAPYTGTTRKKAVAEGWPSLDGKQRSAAHCMASSLLKFDLDGMADAQRAAVLAGLKASCLTFLAYSTWSYGLKPGVRVRVLIPMDASLEQSAYELAWWGLAESLFPELVGLVGNVLDPSAAKICQQQSTWCAAPGREGMAFRVSVLAGVASAEALIKVGEVKHSTANKKPGTWAAQDSDIAITPDAARLKVALVWIPDDYDTWVRAGNCLKALVGVLGDELALNLWLVYCAGGSNTACNDSASYSPETKWETFTPSIPAAALGTLFGMARDGAKAALEGERGSAALSDNGRAAAQYLATYHRALFAGLRGAL